MGRFGIYSVLFALLGIYCSKNFDSPLNTISKADSLWIEDGDKDGVADSLEIWAPNCKLSLEECLELAKENQKETFELWQLNAPQINLDSGSYDSAIVIRISTAGQGQLRYTLDGTTPENTSLLYSDSLVLNDTSFLKVALFKNGELASNIVAGSYYIAIRAEAPQFWPPPSRLFISDWEEGDEIYHDTLKIALSTMDSDAVIRYTFDGSEPTPLNNGYIDSLSVNRNMIIKARSFVPGKEPSPIVTAEYNLVVLEPNANILAGTYPNGQTVTLSINTQGAVIRYTTNGMEPTARSEQYAVPIAIDKTTRLKAKGFKQGWTQSEELNRLYTISIAGQIESPLIEPDGGTFVSSQTITLSVSSDTLDIYYTLDGNIPSLTSTKYVAPFSLIKNTELKARAISVGGDTSNVISSSYLIQNAVPVIDPPGGSYATQQYITISSDDSGAVFKYTLDGSVPDSNSTTYNGNLEIANSATLKVIAIMDERVLSAVAEATYDIQILGNVATPSYSPSSGIFSRPVNVSINCATQGANIYYTQDGSEPDKNSNLYADPVTLDKTTTLKSIAFFNGLNPSQVRTQVFEFKVENVNFSPQGGTYYETKTLYLTSVPEDAEIYYTLDGTSPSEETGLLFEDGIIIDNSVTVKAIAVKDGFTSSDVQSASYIIELAPMQTISLSAPMGGESWTSGTTESITWSTTGDVSEVEIEYSIDGGSTWISISNSAPNIGYYTWTIPNRESNEAKIRVSIVGNNISSESSDVFSIIEPPQSGLWAFYPFSNSVNDESGQGRHGKSNGTSFIADKFGNSANAIQFNSNQDYVEVPGEDNPNMDDERGFTVSLWMRTAQSFLSDAVMISHHGSNNTGYYLSIGSNNLPNFVVPGVGEVQASGFGIARYFWYHIVARYSQGKLSIFLNNVKTEKSVDGTFQASKSSLIMGGMLSSIAQGISNQYIGALDQVRIYNYALSDDEITGLYDNY